MAFTSNAYNYTAAEIASKLHKYYAAKDAVKAAKMELVEIAVNLGMNQQFAQAYPSEFLDGYLAGAGVLPESRVV